MTDTNAEAAFTEEEVVEQAKANVTGSGLALLIYAREHGESPETAARWLGAMFAPGWEEMRGKGARTVARMAALNIVSSGATLLKLDGEEDRAEATVVGWPGDDELEFFGVTLDEADAMFTVFEPIAEALGLQYRWLRQGDAVTMTFEQPAP